MNDAVKSGMRGMERPEATRNVAETSGDYTHPETSSEANMADLAPQHVSTDENGHAQFNLTTFTEHVKTGKKPGQHDG